MSGGRIAASGGDGERRDCSGCLIVPGNVCAHTHLYSALARGMPYTLDPPENFVQVLQRVWWRLDRALDEKAVRASALVGGMEALLSGTTTVIDHHASPNAIDGSLDVIADALATLGIRSILCYETSDRDGPERARAGLAENRRFVHSSELNRPSLTRGMIGAHASFTLSDDTLEACADAARAHGVGVHVHAAEDTADEEDAVMVHGLRVAARLDHAGILDRRTLLAHGVHLDESEVGLVEAAHASIAHNARSNMNNSIGRARVDALGTHVALGTDGIGADMFEESRAAYFRLREDNLASPPSWPLERLAEGRELRRGSVRRAAIRNARGGLSRRPRRPRLCGARSLARVELRRTLDLRPLLAPRPRRHGRGRVGRAGPNADSIRPAGAGGRGDARGRTPLEAPRRRRRPHVPSERRPSMAVATETGADRIALYLQDKHPIRDGMRYAQLAEAARIRGGLAGREPPRARSDRADGRVRRRHRADRDRLGRRQHLDAKRRPARRDVLDARRPRARPDQARDRRVVGPARLEGRHPRGAALSRPCARRSRSRAGC